MLIFNLRTGGKTPRLSASRPTGRLQHEGRHTRSATLTSGTYREPFLASVLRQVSTALFGGRPATPRDALIRDRSREAEEVRELARSVERHSPSFASDLYAAALHHESLVD